MSGQVDFYLLETSDEQSRMKTLCRLAEKIQRMGHEILVLTSDREQSEMLDTLMWTFSQSSFLPHAVADSTDEHQSSQFKRNETGQQVPVMIHHVMLEKLPEVLINLKDDIPQSTDIQRVVEIVNQDELVKINGRQKYRTYKKQNFSIKTHNISTN